MESDTSLRQLFEQALALDGAEREAFVAAHCPDPERRAELERMLDADTRDEPLLASGDAAHAAQAIGETPASEPLPPGSRIGPFELLEVLGEGGSSTVFHAFREVQGVRQEVALKLLHRGLYSAEARHRFRHELDALARLRHPGIARLIEGGTADGGLAYIAMERVEGVPITRYASRHRLSLASRLALFGRVCRAVEAAHRQLVVHRDLKPSNVLVTDEGEVKLVDFGIARLLDSEDEATSTWHRALTPAYAAPEQFEGLPVTTATDVYALGVLLGELLTGQRRQAGDTHTPSSRLDLRLVAAMQLPSPQTARRRLRGDLDNIVVKATAAEPERRYGSAGALAEDIERHLEHRPVAAHPPSRWYRASRFVARHRGGVAVGTVFMLAVLASLAVALWQAQVARQQAQRANAVRDFLVSVFESASSDLPRDQRPTPADLVAQAADRLLADRQLSASMRTDLQLSLARVARSVGASAQALALVTAAEPVVDRLHTPEDDLWWQTRILHAALLNDGDRQRDAAAMLAPLRGALSRRKDETGVLGLRTLGDALVHSGKIDAGLALLAQARAQAARHRLDKAELGAAVDEAEALLDAEHFQRGLARAEATLALWRSQGAHPDPRIINLEEAIALGAEASGDIGRAEKAYRDAIDLGKRFFDKPNPMQAWNVGMYGSFLVAQGRLAEAEPWVTQGLALRREVFGNDDARTLYGIAAMGKLRYAQKRFAEAVHWYSEAVDTCQRLHKHELVCPRVLALRGLARGNLREFTAARSDFDAALKAQAAFSGAHSPQYAYVLAMLMQVQLRQGDFPATLGTADQALNLYGGSSDSMLQENLQTRLIRAEALLGLHRNSEALSELLQIEPAYASHFPTGPARFIMAVQKARALALSGRRHEAADAARNALALAGSTHHANSKWMGELRQIAAGSPSGHR